MVRLYYLAIVQRDDGKNPILYEVSDLSDFGFFKRNSAKEFMRFSCQILVGRTDPGSKVSVREQMYVCHVFVLRDHLAAAAVTDDEYPHTAAHLCLQDLLSDYIRSEHFDGLDSRAPYAGVGDFMEKYKEPRDTDGLSTVRNQLDETKIILHQTIEAIMKRGENLDELVTRTDDLSAQAKTFYKTARKTNACCQTF